jgi:hypothetical protein
MSAQPPDQDLEKADPQVIMLVGAPGEEPTEASLVIVRDYARKVVAGHPDKVARKRYQGTAIEGILRAIDTSRSTAEAWAR